MTPRTLYRIGYAALLIVTLGMAHSSGSWWGFFAAYNAYTAGVLSHEVFKKER